MSIKKKKKITKQLLKKYLSYRNNAAEKNLIGNTNFNKLQIAKVC